MEVEINIQEDLYCQFPPSRPRKISGKMPGRLCRERKAVTLQGQAHKGLCLFHMERGNQSQDSADGVFESAV